jgi:hypothetical protein
VTGGGGGGCLEIPCPLPVGHRVEVPLPEVLGTPLYVGEPEKPVLGPMWLEKQEVPLPTEFVSFSYYYLFVQASSGTLPV